MSWFQRRTVSTTGNQRTSRGRLIAWAVAAIVSLVIGVPYGWLRWQLSSGHRALQDGHPELALQALTNAARFAPNSAEAQYRLAVAERRAGHLDRVAPCLELAMKLGWPNEDIQRQSLLTVAQGGDVDAVDPQLKAIMRRGTGDEAAAEIYEALAIGFMKTYRLKEAWECLNFWSEWQPNAVFPKYWRADICRRIDNPVLEEREYREILKIEPAHTAARCRLAEVLKNSNRLEEAEREFKQCLAQEPLNPDVLIGLADCRRRLGDGASATPLLEQALKLALSPIQRCMSLTHLGQIDSDEGRIDAAVEHLEEAVRLAPYEGASTFALSQAYALRGDTDRAKELAERTDIVRAEHARVDEIAKSLVDHPGNADLRYEAGRILIELGMKDEGIVWLQTALQMQPSHEKARKALSALSASNEQSPWPK